jgi:hypothetical protein
MPDLFDTDVQARISCVRWAFFFAVSFLWPLRSFWPPEDGARRVRTSLSRKSNTAKQSLVDPIDTLAEVARVLSGVISSRTAFQGVLEVL